MPTVHLTLSPELTLHPDAKQAAEAATEQLRGLPGPDELFADWGVATDSGGRQALVLTLRLPPDHITATFRADELDGEMGWSRMNRSYRQVLSQSVRRSLSEIASSLPDATLDPEEQLEEAR